MINCVCAYVHKLVAWLWLFSSKTNNAAVNGWLSQSPDNRHNIVQIVTIVCQIHARAMLYLFMIKIK